jgi:ATP-dependent Lon protease
MSPLCGDMFEVGCVSTILQMLKLPDGTVKVLVEGQQRATGQPNSGRRRAFRGQLDACRVPADAAATKTPRLRPCAAP